VVQSHSSSPVSPVITCERHFNSFGEFAAAFLPSRPLHPIHHVFWEEKTPFPTVTPDSSLQQAMAFHFVDLTPFLPPGTQRQMINYRPIMRHVVVGHVPRRNNDLAIAILNPMPQGPVDFWDIHVLLDDFLRNRAEVEYQSMQSCPFGQAFVHFNHIHERDLLIQGSPHQFGNGIISFVPHDRAWNNRTTIMTHEVWMMMLRLDIDLWTRSLVEKFVSSFGQLMIWEEDHYHLSRAIVKVRVSSLEDIP
jgi:hypothetical protein